MRQSLTAVRNSLFGLASQAIQVGTLLVLLPYVVSKVGEAAYSVFLLAFGIVAFLEMLRAPISRTCDVAMATARETGDTEGANRTMSASVALGFVPGVVGFLILAGGGELLYRFFELPPDLHWETLAVCFLAGLTILLCFPMYPFQGVVLGYQRHDIYYMVMGGTALLRAVLVVALFELGLASVAVLMAVSTLVLVLAQVILRSVGYRLHPKLKVRLRGLRRDDFDMLLGFGSFIFLTRILLMLDREVGKWIAGKMLGPKYITFLWVATMVVLMAYRVVQQVSIVLVPIAARYHARSDERLLQQTLIRGCRYCLLLAAIVLAPVLVQMDVFLRLWMGSDYVWLTPFAIPLGFVVVVTGSSSASAQILQGCGDAKRPFIAMVFALAGGVATMIGGLFAGWDFGAIVAGLAVGQAIRWGVLTAQGTSVCRCGPGTVLWQAYLQPLVPVALGTAGVWLIRRWLEPTTWVSFFAVYAIGAVLICLLLLPIMTREEWGLAREVIAKVTRRGRRPEA